MSKYFTKRKEVVDIKTGEVYTVVSIIPEERDKDFIKVFKLCSEKVIQDFRDYPGCLVLIFYIMNQLKYEDDRFYLYPQDAMKECRISKRSFYSYIKMLIEKNYIKKDKPTHWYRINPNYIYRGSVVRHYQNLIEGLPTQ